MLSKYYTLYDKSVWFKDMGLLKSALKMREEATQAVSDNVGYYAIGKANEAHLLGHHIGDGLRAYEAVKVSLKNIEAFAEADVAWKAKKGFSLLDVSLAYVGNWAESYEKSIYYCELLHRWTAFPNVNVMLQQISESQKKGEKWWEYQRGVSYNFYDRTSPEKDAGKHASAMAILHCIIDRACKEEVGYEMDSSKFFDILDDYMMLALLTYELISQKFHVALDRGVPLAGFDCADEQFMIFQNPLKYWQHLMPHCPEDWKPVFQAYYDRIMQITCH